MRSGGKDSRHNYREQRSDDDALPTQPLCKDPEQRRRDRNTERRSTDRQPYLRLGRVKEPRKQGQQRLRRIKINEREQAHRKTATIARGAPSVGKRRRKVKRPGGSAAFGQLSSRRLCCKYIQSIESAASRGAGVGVSGKPLS